jgi:hypothetical protein
MSADAGEIAGERRQFDGRRDAAGSRHAPQTGPRSAPRRPWRSLRARLARALEDEWERGTGFVFLPVMMGRAR